MTNVKKSDSRDGLFLRLLLRASFGAAAWRRVASVQPAGAGVFCIFFVELVYFNEPSGGVCISPSK